MARRLPRSPWLILVLGVLLSLVLFRLATSNDTAGVFVDLLRWGKGSALRSPSATVLKGKSDIGGLDWPTRLKEDQFYFTAGNLGGLSNQIMSGVHTIYIALLTSRVPIIPPIEGYASQLGGDLVTSPLQDLPFSSIFDLPRLFEHLNQEHGLAGIVEWSELVNITKRFEPQASEGWNATRDWVDLSCWTAHPPGRHSLLNQLRINPTFTDLPPLLLFPGPILSIPSLISYLHRDSAIIDPYLQAINESVARLPSTKLACVDNVFYASNEVFVSSEWAGNEGREVGAWPAVGRHLRWTPELKDRGDTVARWLFGSRASGEPVEFISVHIRHGDFLDKCPPPSPDSTIIQHCWSSAQYAHAVQTIKASIFWESGRLIDQVFVATDDTDAGFLEEIRGRGWKMVDESTSLRIRREWGDWYPTLIDNVLLSMGASFVGTVDSTMSIVNARRVQDWNRGPPPIYVRRDSPTGAVAVSTPV